MLDTCGCMQYVELNNENRIEQNISLKILIEYYWANVFAIRVENQRGLSCAMVDSR